MEKTMTLNLRVSPDVKQNAETVLKQLGVPMATAVDMFLRQIAMTGSIPFSIALPKAPVRVNADAMTPQEIHAELKAGYDDMLAGRVHDAAAAFSDFRKAHQQ